MIRQVQSMQLPGEVNSTTAERVLPTAPSSNDQSYWKAFSDGFVEGFSLPFAALFGLVGCTSRPFPLVDHGVADAGAHTDAGSDAVGDASKDAGINGDTAADTVGIEAISDDVDVAEVAPDATDDTSEVDLNDATEEVALPDAVTEDVAPEVEDTEEVFQDAAADLPEDATLTDAAEDVALPQDATEDVAPDGSDSGICQYFCGVDSLGTPDAVSPTDVTLADATTPTTVGVTSKICNTPISGPLTLSAPLNSVAAACTNDSINALLLGAKGCVAECGFYDDNVILSTAPNTPVKFALDLFTPPQAPMQTYTITLALQSPVLSDGFKPSLPGFLGSSFVFAFNQKLYNEVGDIVWEAQDKDAKGAVKGTVQIKYQPEDFFFKLSEFLDITYTDLAGSKVAYRYPCTTLVDSQGVPNAIVNCAEVK